MEWTYLEWAAGFKEQVKNLECQRGSVAIFRGYHGIYNIWGRNWLLGIIFISQVQSTTMDYQDGSWFSKGSTTSFSNRGDDLGYCRSQAL